MLASEAAMHGLSRLQGKLSAVIFDFDGVIADSEMLANTVLAQFVSDLGRPTTTEEALFRYSGRRWSDAMATLAAQLGAPIPVDFPDRLQAATLNRFRSDLREVTGARQFINAVSHLPFAIASSSSTPRLNLCLEVLGLTEVFSERVFSADQVLLGKPHPAIFLLAAQHLGIEPDRCLVIEDSRAGVAAAVAAGMTAIGFCAGSHCRPGHENALRGAGAASVAFSWSEAALIVEGLKTRS